MIAKVNVNIKIVSCCCCCCCCCVGLAWVGVVAGLTLVRVGLGCFGRLFNFGEKIFWRVYCFGGLFGFWFGGLFGCEKVFHWVFVWANVFYIRLSVGLPGHFHTIGWSDEKYLRRKIIKRRNSYGICIFLGHRVEINAGIH